MRGDPVPDGKVELRMGYGETEDQRAVMLRDDDWPDSLVMPLGADGYHTVKLVYDPRDTLVDVHVNGVLVLEDASYMQKGVDVIDNLYVIWGGVNAGNANDAINDYSLVRFELGTDLDACMMGDADCDGVVNDDELSLLSANWGEETIWSHGEFNELPPVNDDDLSLLLANWIGAGAVREPMTLVLLGIGAVAMFRRRT